MNQKNQKVEDFKYIANYLGMRMPTDFCVFMLYHIQNNSSYNSLYLILDWFELIAEYKSLITRI